MFATSDGFNHFLNKSFYYRHIQMKNLPAFIAISLIIILRVCKKSSALFDNNISHWKIPPYPVVYDATRLLWHSSSAP